MTSRLPLMLSAALCAAAPLTAKDTAYIGSVHIVPGDAETVQGTVFLDADRDSVLDDGEAGVEGVLVSNGREVVVTDADGRYDLPPRDDMNVFVTKPAGYATPLDAQLVPQFSYVHKPEGSPDLRYGGIAPTGPLPAAINFPLVEDDSDRANFDCLVFGDAQPYSNTQLSYVRETAGRMLAARDASDTECLIFQGDVMGDDLSLYPRFKEIISVGDTPQYAVAGNHDLDFDARSDADSFDTFRRAWGPEYYSFDIGKVHFVVLDNVRYPCNGVDDHAVCDPAERLTYNGVIHDRQMAWLANDLDNVPQDRLIVLNAHIPFQTFTDNRARKHQTDNLAELAEIIGDRPALGLSGHTHTTENIEPGEHYAGWEEVTGVGPAPFHQIVTGALSGSWWSGNLDDAGVPEATQRLGSPRGYYRLEVSGTDWIDTYHSFRETPETQMHAAFSTPRFRDWAADLMAYADLYGRPSEVLPPVTRTDLGDMNMLTRTDLEGGTWVAVNVWNGSMSSRVSVSIDGGAAIEARRTQVGEGEAKQRGPAYADPHALARQSTDTRVAWRSAQGGEATAGYEMFRGVHWTGVPGPLPRWLLTDSSQHLWRADLPADLPAGVHVMEVRTTDRHGRTFRTTLPFEVVEEMPQMGWQSDGWE